MRADPGGRALTWRSLLATITPPCRDPCQAGWRELIVLQLGSVPIETYAIPGFSDPFSSLTHLLGAVAFACLTPFLLLKGRGNSAPKRAAATNNVPAEAPPSPLEQLEEQIDECLSLAKSLDRDRLSHVISMLRHARNLVVWEHGR